MDQAENRCVIGFICLTEIHVDQNQMTAFPVKKLLIKAAPFLELLKFQLLKILAYLFLRTSCTKESGSGIPVKLHGHPETEITVCPGITSLGFIAVTDIPEFLTDLIFFRFFSCCNGLLQKLQTLHGIFLSIVFRNCWCIHSFFLLISEYYIRQPAKNTPLSVISKLFPRAFHFFSAVIT